MKVKCSSCGVVIPEDLAVRVQKRKLDVRPHFGEYIQGSTWGMERYEAILCHDCERQDQVAAKDTENLIIYAVIFGAFAIFAGIIFLSFLIKSIS